METAQTTQNTQPSAQPVVYDRSRRRLILLLVAIMCFVLAGVFAGIEWQTGRGSQLILCAVLLAAAGVSVYFWYMFRHERIETSAEGISYYHPLYSLYSPWSNVAHRTVWPVPRSTVEALQLVQPATAMSIEQGKQENRAAVTFTGRRALIVTDDHARFIPVGYFMSEWHHTGLADDIRQHAPQVFSGNLTGKNRHWQLW